MHMSDALISVPTGVTFWAVSIGTMAYSVKKLRKEEKENTIPLMGVMAAFVFALQMVNFSIPGTGSSGHFAGGFLLSIILGPYLAFLSMASVLIVQALFFADGGILALGCNIFNMGFVPSFVVYPLIDSLLKNKLTNFAIWLGAALSLLIGAISVALQTAVSGIAELPFSRLLYLMVFIHLLISIVEGLITVGAYNIIHKIYPSEDYIGDKLKPVVPIFVITIMIASIFSLFASEKPDGLEWSVFKIIGEEKEPTSLIASVHHFLGTIQEKISFLPDYNFHNNQSNLGTSISGIIGSIITIIFAAILGILTNRKTDR